VVSATLANGRIASFDYKVCGAAIVSRAGCLLRS
jgi:hypothetical protein